MGKLPASLFYWGDWARDLEEYPLDVEGAWIRICCKLHYSDTRGTLSRTLEQWAKILREPQDKTVRILHDIQVLKIGNITPILTDVTNCNGDVTVSSRRMLKEEKDKQDTRNRVAKYRSKEPCNGIVTKKKRRCNTLTRARAETETKEVAVSLSKNKEVKIKYLDFVFLSSVEYKQLSIDYGEKNRDDLMNRLNLWVGQVGEVAFNKKYKSHYFTILNIARRDGIKKKAELNKEEDY